MIWTCDAVIAVLGLVCDMGGGGGGGGGFYIF